ncbi:hypothetical protein B0H10DRAFT_2333904 [Mycena sp. CBHHK59/15]|nr:hypothetical protein B0H10DRAFT_2333904 [Mycena sp. CBHHK59/15]
MHQAGLRANTNNFDCRRQRSGVDPAAREGSSTHAGDLASPVIAGVPELRTRIQVGGSRGSDRQRSRLQADGRARARETTESPCQHSVADPAARTSARRRRIERMLAPLAGELERVVPAGQQHSDGRSSSTWWSILQHSRTHVGPVRGRARGCDARRTAALGVIRRRGLLLPVAIHDGLVDVPSIVPSLCNADSGGRVALAADADAHGEADAGVDGELMGAAAGCVEAEADAVLFGAADGPREVRQGTRTRCCS